MRITINGVPGVCIEASTASRFTRRPSSRTGCIGNAHACAGSRRQWPLAQDDVEARDLLFGQLGLRLETHPEVCAAGRVPDSMEDPISGVLGRALHVHPGDERLETRDLHREMDMRSPTRTGLRADGAQAVSNLRTGTGPAVALEVLVQRRIAPVARMVIAAVRVALPALHLHAGNRSARWSFTTPLIRVITPLARRPRPPTWTRSADEGNRRHDAEGAATGACPEFPMSKLKLY